MDVVNLGAACGLALQSALFVPLDCAQSLGANAPIERDFGLASIDRWAAYIAEASQRFGVPQSWIRTIMQTESGGYATLDGRPITSPAGAMGLMQVMPSTYATLRDRYQLGADAYDPRNNILAGAAYIRELADQFGAPDFLAAYNAGPERLRDFLLRGRSLPSETQHYLQRIGDLGSVAAAPDDDKNRQSSSIPGARSTPTGNGSAPPILGAIQAQHWQRQREAFVDNDSVFVTMIGARPVRNGQQRDTPPAQEVSVAQADSSPGEHLGGGLFVRLDGAQAAK
jgi:hypothetical protein